jgi:2',3'-cyclic-nucleotide 2'-phosphodiesterase (5'-nucleotidase family)
MTRRTFLALGLLLGVATLPAQSQAQPDVRPLTILHSNDLHARLLPNDLGAGGFARLATAVRKEKANCAACLYLNAGDLVQGTPVSTFYRGLPIYEIGNLLGIDVGTLGNHEFDYGWRRVQQFSRIAKYPVLSANVVDAKGVSITGKPYVIKTVGGIRVAIIGVVLGDLADFVGPSDVEPWRVLPVVETVRKYAQELRGQSDLIVVLGHIHDEQEARAILQRVPEVSVAVVGHTHAGYTQMMNVDGRVGVLVNGYGAEIGRLDLKVDIGAKRLRSADWKKIPIDSTIAPDPDVARLVSHWEGKVSKLVDIPIGESKRRIEGEELRALMERAVSEETGSDLAFFNKGNLRDVLPQGRILARHIWNIFPFEDRIVVGKFKGSQLPKAVTAGRVIDPEREYTLATTDFTAAQQNLPDQLGATGMAFPKVERLQRDIVIEWIKKQKVLP